MKTDKADQTKLFWQIMMIIILIGCFTFMIIMVIGISHISDPREISYKHKLPNSATDINEKTDYLQGPPDEEYRYYMKAKITQQEYLEFKDALKLEYAVRKSRLPSKIPQISWWDPPTETVFYAHGDIFTSDYDVNTGYVYFYIEQN